MSEMNRRGFVARLFGGVTAASIPVTQEHAGPIGREDVTTVNVTIDEKRLAEHVIDAIRTNRNGAYVSMRAALGIDSPRT